MISQADFARLVRHRRADRQADEADADVLRRADGHRVQVFRRAEGRDRGRRDGPGRPAGQHQRHQARSHGDHQHQQGPHGPARAHARPKIAEEKAGIFKPGVPAISVHAGPGGRGRAEAASPRRSGRRSTSTGKSIEFSYRFESSRMLGPHNRVCLTTPNSKFEHLAVPLIGEHQAINCGLALAVIDKLKSARLRRSTTPRRWKAWPRPAMPGRMEMVEPDAARGRRRRPQRRQRRRDDAGHRPAHPVRLDGRHLRLLRRQGRRRDARADHQRRRQGDLHQASTTSARPTRTSWRRGTSELYGKMAQVAADA